MIDDKTLQLRHIPFFKHLTDDELSVLATVAKPRAVAKGANLQCDAHSLYVVQKGIFEIQKQTESIYLSQSSFFGELPFCERRTGVVRALTDSILYEFKDTDLYQFLCNSFKILRGYIRISDFYRLPLTDAGKILNRNKTQILTVFSTSKHCGKTTIAVALAAACSLNKRTILLDASYDGISIFDMCGKQLIPPLSQKNPDEVTGQKFIEQRIEKVSETMDILNVAYGSKVRINPDIINPLLFYLSFEYSYIVIDCSDIDTSLRDTVLQNSDIIVEIVNNKSAEKIQLINDTHLTQGQQIVPMVNRHFEKDAKIDGVYHDFDTISIQPHETVFQGIIQSDVHKSDFIKNILADKKSLVLSSGMYETLFFAAMFEELRDLDNVPDILYAIGIPYALYIASLHYESHKEYKKLLLQHFSDDKLHSWFNVTFPDKYLFKNDPLKSFSSSISTRERIEWYKTVPYTMLMSDTTMRMFSTGPTKDFVAASFAMQPFFEGIEIDKTVYYTPFPLFTAIPETLLRTHIQNIVYCSLKSSGHLIHDKTKVLGIFRKFVDFIPYYCLYACDNGVVCNKEISIQVPEVTSVTELIKKSFEQRDIFMDIVNKITGV